MSSKTLVFIDSRVVGDKTLIASSDADTGWYLLSTEADGVKAKDDPFTSLLLRQVEAIKFVDATEALGAGSMSVNGGASTDKDAALTDTLHVATDADVGYIIYDDKSIYGCNMAAKQRIKPDIQTKISQFTKLGVQACL